MTDEEIAREKLFGLGCKLYPSYWYMPAFGKVGKGKDPIEALEEAEKHLERLRAEQDEFKAIIFKRMYNNRYYVYVTSIKKKYSAQILIKHADGTTETFHSKYQIQTEDKMVELMKLGYRQS